MSYIDIETDYLTIRKGTLFNTDLNVSNKLDVIGKAFISNRLGIGISNPLSDLDISGNTGITLPLYNNSNQPSIPDYDAPIGTMVYQTSDISGVYVQVAGDPNNFNQRSGSDWKRLLFFDDISGSYQVNVNNNNIIEKIQQ